MMVNWKHKLSLVCGIFVSFHLSADTLHGLDRIEQVAYEYALKQAQASYDNPLIVMDSLDSRLRLQACDAALDVFSTNGAVGLGNQTIGVKCNTPVAWTVYVPVKVKVLKPVVVASKPLSSNQLITESDLKLQQVDIGSLQQGYLSNTQLVVGQQLKYPVSMGSVIKPNSLQSQKVVHRGEIIMLVAMAGQMEVRMSGTALDDATLGERIKVKNTTSKRIVEGVVDAPGIVKVAL
jgi:flagellar basal body P-ring formation protein FlgA